MPYNLTKKHASLERERANIGSQTKSTTYLDDQVLECFTVLWRLRVEVACETIDGKHFQVVDALVSLLHLLEACLVVAARHHFTMIDLLVAHHLLVLLLELQELFLVDALAFTLTLTLSEHLDLEGFLMSVLPHHSLQLKSVTV